MKYIVYYTKLEDGKIVQSCDIAYSKEDIPFIIKDAKDTYLAENFLVFELCKEVTKEFVDNEK